MPVATGHNIELRIWTPCNELKSRKLGVWINLLFVNDSGIAECLQSGDHQRTKRVSDQIVGLEQSDLGLVPVQSDVIVDIRSRNAQLSSQIDSQVFRTLQYDIRTTRHLELEVIALSIHDDVVERLPPHA